MTIHLNLVVPEADQTADLIDRYYDYHIEKCRQAPMDFETEIGFLEDRREFALDWLADKGEFGISKQIPQVVAKSDVYHDLLDFMVRENPNGYVREDPADIETVIEFLREAQAELLDNAPVEYDDYWLEEKEIRYNFEYRPIPLCEFAREEGYGISWEH